MQLHTELYDTLAMTCKSIARGHFSSNIHCLSDIHLIYL
jgi:hypothetical protein